MNYELRPLPERPFKSTEGEEPRNIDPERSQLLLEFNNAVVSQLDLDGLLKSIFDGIKRVFSQTVGATLSIHDPETNELRVHLLHSEDPELLSKGMSLALEGTPSGLAFTSQRVVLIHRLVYEDFPTEIIKRGIQDGFKSSCSVPLVSHNRTVGTVTLASTLENGYSEEDADLLAQVGQQIAIPIENALNFRSAKKERDRNQLLLDVNNAVASNLDVQQLLTAISKRLQAVIPHDATGLSIWDEEIKQLRMHAVAGINAVQLGVAEGTPIPLEGTPAGLAYTTRKTVLRGRSDFEEFHNPVFGQIMRFLGINSGCAVPLILEDRVVGVVTLGSRKEGAFSEADGELLEQISTQLAIAVENAINFRRAKRERDRKQLLLDINNAVVTNLTLNDLLETISDCLDKTCNHDSASISLFDETTKQFRLHAKQLKYSSTVTDGFLYPMEGTPAGNVFATRKTLRLPLIKSEDFPAPIVQHALADGLRSGCSIPLIVHEQFLGVLEIASKSEDAFSEANAEVLTQVAGQIAIAVQNSVNFERANRERERAETLLEVNNALTTNLDLNDLIKATSDCLRGYFKHDFAGMALYDEDSGKLRVHSHDTLIADNYLTQGLLLSIEGTLTGQAFSSREPIVRNRFDPTETSSTLAQKFTQEQGLKSLCFIPMILAGRAVGVLNLGCKREDAFSDDDVELLLNIAAQTAIAVQNSLNFERANRERQRAEMLLEINNAITTNLDLRDLIHATAESLRRYFEQDFAGIALYDEETGQLTVHSIDSSRPEKFLIEGAPFPMEGTLNGLAFTTQIPVVRNRIDPAESSWALAKQFFEEHRLKSACFVPMISGGETVGVLSLGNRIEDAYSEEDVQLLVQIAAQISIAVRNSLNFDRAKKAKERAQTLLEVNNAVATSLDVADLLRATASCLRRYFNHDVTGIALYDESKDALIVHSIDRHENNEFVSEGTALPDSGTPAAVAFSTGRPILEWRMDFEQWPSPRMKVAYDAGWRSGACVPLIVRDRILGTLGLASFQEDGFSKYDSDLLISIAGQVALACENTIQYRQIEALKNKLASEKHYLEEEIKTRYNFAEIVGHSNALKEVLRHVETVAPTDSTVLLIGETGTGKELIARAIHNLSSRKERTLVKLNCAAIPTGLLESELFGHEKGAFTGAIGSRVGRFELANKGTLLLDEIGEIPLELQPKLLRVLQEHEFERLGSSRTVKTDTRLVAATNCNLEQMVAEKKFRSDLYYRLNVFPIFIPPLRERTGDIPLLVSYFTQKHGARMNKKIQSIPTPTMDALCNYHWPGNVRELENFIERSVILSQDGELQSPLSELQPARSADGNGAAATPARPKLTTMDEMEKAYIEQVLSHVNGAIAGKGGAAEILGMPSSTLRSRMKKLGLK